MPDRSAGDWTLDLRTRLSRLRLSPAREAEIIEELSQHLDDRVDELCAAGASNADARRVALEELSDAGELARRMQPLSQASMPAPIVHGRTGSGLLRGLWQDMHFALRAARRQPGFAATIVLTLALGIAVNTTAFTLVNGAVFRPLPFADPDRIVRLSMTNLGNAQAPFTDLSYLDFHDWRSARATFEDLGAVGESGVDLSGDGRPAAAAFAAFVSWNMFSLLGEPPELGRDFAESDDRAGAAPAVILSGNLWRSRYGADPDIVGSTIRVDGVPSTVVGVMSRDFGFPDRSELWLPLAALPEETRTARGVRRLDGVGRLRPGVSIEQAVAELSGIAASLAERFPDTNRNTAPRVDPYGINGEIVTVMMVLLGAVGFVLLIACANVANLLLARAADRSRDVTLRLALGASRWRIARQLLAESLLLAAAGGAVGLALSYAGVQLLVSNFPADGAPPYWIQFPIDRAVFAYLVILCGASALVSGLVPAWHASRTTLAAALNDASRGSSGGRHRRRWVGAFVVAQVALALMLLSGAGLMVQNLVRLTRIDIGIESEGLMQTFFNLRRPEYSPERRGLFFGQLQERFAAGGIEAALASHPPLGGALEQRLRVEGQAVSDPAALPVVSVVRVGQRYFDVMGAPIVAGRTLAGNDLRQHDDTVVVNERFARMYFQDQPAVGRRISLIEPSASAGTADGSQWMTIVGVVGNVRQQWLPSGDFDPVVYRPYAADPPRAMFVLTRSAAGRLAPAAAVTNAVAALDPGLPLVPATTVDEAIARQFWPQRLFGSLFGIVAAIAMLLATSGLYAVTAYAVSRRTREIGVRVALGADARGVWWTVTGATFRQLAIGLTLGLAGAAAVGTMLPAMLVGAGGGQPLVLVLVALVLVAAGVAASALPARRAVRLDPVTALHAE
jgi:predicted permease